jgi:hypothetical protein
MPWLLRSDRTVTRGQLNRCTRFSGKKPASTADAFPSQRRRKQTQTRRRLLRQEGSFCRRDVAFSGPTEASIATTSPSLARQKLPSPRCRLPWYGRSFRRCEVGFSPLTSPSLAPGKLPSPRHRLLCYERSFRQHAVAFPGRGEASAGPPGAWRWSRSCLRPVGALRGWGGFLLLGLAPQATGRGSFGASRSAGFRACIHVW